MKVVIGGVRGTTPVAQPEFMRFGGETTSVLVEGLAGESLVIDAGTGVRVLGQRLQATAPTRSVLMLMTHYHLDHIMGLPSLGLIYNKDWTIEMASPPRGEWRVATMMHRILDKPLWPLQVSDLESWIRFTDLADESAAAPLRRGNLFIRWTAIPHPGGCAAYRIDEAPTGHSLVMATDVEWSSASAAERAAFLGLCTQPSPADILLFDGQYTPEECEAYRGWGHSTWLQAVDVAREAGVGRLLITHHDPRKDDPALEEIDRLVMAAWPRARLARAGEELALPPRG